jgi:type I site-specific restriction-modification system R (restriction) subunit
MIQFHPANNDFLLASQFSVAGALYTCRPDLVGFVNGLPLVVVELKKPGVPGLASAFIQCQRDESALLSSRRDKRENCDTL